MIGPFDADDAATPLMPAERDGLIPTHITLRSELNELEQQNIAEADRWAFSRQHKILREPFLRNLHRRMFNRVWRWAGKYRASERNLGIESYRVEPELRQIIDDAQYWIDHQSYPTDEAAVRFHHRLVVVHPFPNGNGRWSRLAGDLLGDREGRDNRVVFCASGRQDARHAQLMLQRLLVEFASFGQVIPEVRNQRVVPS